jgi:hypothetical protein
LTEMNGPVFLKWHFDVDNVRAWMERLLRKLLESWEQYEGTFSCRNKAVSSKHLAIKSRKRHLVVGNVNSNMYVGIYLGSMLWSQFSAIFETFRRKILVFFLKAMLLCNFCLLLFFLPGRWCPGRRWVRRGPGVDLMNRFWPKLTYKSGRF